MQIRKTPLVWCSLCDKILALTTKICPLLYLRVGPPITYSSRHFFVGNTKCVKWWFEGSRFWCRKAVKLRWEEVSRWGFWGFEVLVLWSWWDPGASDPSRQLLYDKILALTTKFRPVLPLCAIRHKGIVDRSVPINGPWIDEQLQWFGLLAMG